LALDVDVIGHYCGLSTEREKDNSLLLFLKDPFRVYANVADDCPTRLSQRRNNKIEFQTNKRNSISDRADLFRLGNQKGKKENVKEE
jgi:hypothetical protein